MSLSPDKEKALEIFTDFMSNKNKKIMLIQGPPGVGKTYFINKIVETYINTNTVTSLIDPKTKKLTSSNVILTATTHKAKKVIIDDVTDNISKEYKMDFKTCTIHSLLGLKVYYNYKMELAYSIDKNFVPFNFNSNNSLLIIDEASYIDTKLAAHINTLVNQNPKLKLVYVADKYQGKPVKEDISPIFTQYDTYAELSSRFRFPEGGSIHLNSVSIEDFIKNETPIDLVYDDNFKIVGQQEFVDIVNNEIVTSTNPATKIIVYHNKTANYYNNEIQVAKYKSSRIQPNQVLINNNTYINRKDSISIPNEQIVTVANVEKDSKYISGIECICLYLKGFRAPFYIIKDYKTYNKKLAKAKADKDWTLFYTLQESFIDLRQPWAMTSHKSQGSTFNNVIIDANDLELMPKEDFYHMLNVAITRAKNNVYVYRSDLE